MMERSADHHNCVTENIHCPGYQGGMDPVNGPTEHLQLCQSCAFQQQGAVHLFGSVSEMNIFGLDDNIV